MDKGFFLSGTEWTCYRRNYFQISASFALSGSQDDTLSNYSLLIDGSSHQIKNFSIAISCHVYGGDKGVDLVQHTAKRDKGPQIIPSPKVVLPGGNPYSFNGTTSGDYAGTFNSSFAGMSSTTTGNTSFAGNVIFPSSGSPATSVNSGNHSSENIGNPNINNSSQLSDVNRLSPEKITSPNLTEKIVTFERLQFKSATANNGKRRAAQQYYCVTINLFARLSSGQLIKVATADSAPLVVRGRSPGHYTDLPVQGIDQFSNNFNALSPASFANDGRLSSPYTNLIDGRSSGLYTNTIPCTDPSLHFQGGQNIIFNGQMRGQQISNQAHLQQGFNSQINSQKGFTSHMNQMNAQTDFNSQMNQMNAQTDFNDQTNTQQNFNGQMRTKQVYNAQKFSFQDNGQVMSSDNSLQSPVYPTSGSNNIQNSFSLNFGAPFSASLFCNDQNFSSDDSIQFRNNSTMFRSRYPSAQSMSSLHTADSLDVPSFDFNSELFQQRKNVHSPLTSNWQYHSPPSSVVGNIADDTPQTFNRVGPNQGQGQMEILPQLPGPLDEQLKSMATYQQDAHPQSSGINYQQQTNQFQYQDLRQTNSNLSQLDGMNRILGDLCFDDDLDFDIISPIETFV